MQTVTRFYILYIYIIYVCMYVCMHACMYVYMYVCIHISMYLCMYVCMYVCIHICMYVCITNLGIVEVAQLEEEQSEVAQRLKGLLCAISELASVLIDSGLLLQQHLVPLMQHKFLKFGHSTLMQSTAATAGNAVTAFTITTATATAAAYLSVQQL